MYKWQNEQILLSWKVKRYSTATGGKAGKLKQCITIIKSTNCIHMSSGVASATSWFWKIVETEWITCQDFLSTTYLTIISEFPASTISNLSNIQDFLMLIPMPSHWLQPVSQLSHINQRPICTNTEWALYPAFDINATFLTYSDFFSFSFLFIFFFNLEASCWNLDSINLKCERSCQVQAMTHTRKKDTVTSQLSDQLWF